MKNKKLILAVVVLIALVGILLGVYFLAGPGAKVDTGATEGTDTLGNTITGCHFTVIVVHSDNTEKTFTYTTDAEKLGAFLEAEGLIDSAGADTGMFHTVDGEKASWEENKSYWALYIGEEYAMTGIYDTPITNDGIYKLVYTLG